MCLWYSEKHKLYTTRKPVTGEPLHAKYFFSDKGVQKNVGEKNPEPAVKVSDFVLVNKEDYPEWYKEEE